MQLLSAGAPSIWNAIVPLVGLMADQFLQGIGAEAMARPNRR